MGGIVDTIQLAAVLVFAIPAALAGLDLLLVGGEPLLGGALVFLAVALVWLKRYLTTPTDVPVELASRAEDAITPDDEE
ncbi:DUF7533 family protein [Halovivax cerinus]|uniref:Uncharacterized protein n=1 Tax=Halovivax cerinus TaxID=1487865 RepID=A0ABD5NQY5_9EURY|nr:hypothetical protein [Halovivax cerinus]